MIFYANICNLIPRFTFKGTCFACKIEMRTPYIEPSSHATVGSFSFLFVLFFVFNFVTLNFPSRMKMIKILYSFSTMKMEILEILYFFTYLLFYFIFSYHQLSKIFKFKSEFNNLIISLHFF
jgi:hypothetical protein